MALTGDMELMVQRLSGQTAIVTGAARGIGYATAERLGEAGAAVMLCDKSGDTVAKAAETLRASGITTAAIKCDVTDRTETARMVANTVDRFGGLDILVNNAGIATRATFTELSPDEWDEVIDVNLTGVFNCAHAAVPELRSDRGGNIVNISSMAGRNISYHAAANYTASKWGVIGLTKHLAWDLSEHNIRVNAVCPGSTLTPLIEETTSAEARKATREKIPLDRWATPADQANGVLYLVSEEGAYLTGTILEIDGGKQLGIRHEI